MDLITVRRAESRDSAALAEIHVRSWQVGYADILSKAFLDELRIDPKAERWQRSLTNPARRSTTWVVEVGGHPVGFAGLAAARDADLDPLQWQELITMYLLPEAWGTGAAHALATAALNEGTRYSLWVLADNQRAQSFYRKLGFVADGAEEPITIGDRTLWKLRMRRPADKLGG